MNNDLLEALQKIENFCERFPNSPLSKELKPIATEAIKKWEDSPGKEDMEKIIDDETERRYPVRTHIEPELSPYKQSQITFKHGVLFGLSLKSVPLEDSSGKETGRTKEDCLRSIYPATRDTEGNFAWTEKQIYKAMEEYKNQSVYKPNDDLRLTIYDELLNWREENNREVFLFNEIQEIIKKCFQSVPPYKEEEHKCKFCGSYIHKSKIFCDDECKHAWEERNVEAFKKWQKLNEAIDNPPYKEEAQNYMKPEYWKDKLPNLSKALEEEDFECDRCDGCGWYEGGKTLKTTCEKCGGTGVIKKPKQYKEEVDKELYEDVQRDNSSFYTYFRIDFEDWGEDFDFTICETLDEVREMLQLAEIHLDEPDRHTKVIVTGLPMTPPQYEKFKKGEEWNFLESKEEAGEIKSAQIPSLE
jgi:rRNA maturation protein Nop10